MRRPFCRTGAQKWRARMVACLCHIPIVYRISISDKRRYLEKTKEIGDPYGYSLSALSQDELPPVGSTDIFNYLVLSTSFCTSERFKAYKSMDAYKYFLSGFVGYVAARKVEKKYVVLGQVSDCITNVQLQKGNIYILFIYLEQYYIYFVCMYR